MTLIKPSLFQLLVGVSLTGITAGLLYILLGKDEDDVEEFVQRIKTSRSITIEVKIPKDCVGVVIGKAGANIKEIQDKSETKINFKDDEQADAAYRVCIIRGSPESAQLAESLIHEFIANQPLIEVASMSVPKSACGRIIGKGGENVRSISRTSGAKVNVDPNNSTSSDPFRRVIIKGTGDQIEIAKALIQEKVEEEMEAQRRSDGNVRNPRGQENLHYLTAGPETQIKPNENSRRDFYKNNELMSLRQCNGANHCMLQEGNSEANLLKVLKLKLQQNDADATEKLIAVSNDQTIEVYVCAVSSPSTFWVQLYGPSAGELDFLVDNMTDYYNKEENQEVHRIKSPLKVNQMVAALFGVDEKWYRAKVVAIRENEYDSTESEVEVFYVDYGDSETLKQKHLYHLRTDFLELKYQAIECALANVVPKDSETWSSEAIDSFELLSHNASWVKMTARVQSYQPGKGHGTLPCGLQAACIELFDTNAPEAPSIAAELVKQGFADWKKNLSDSNGASQSKSPQASPSPYSSHQSIASDKGIGNSTSCSGLRGLKEGDNHSVVNCLQVSDTQKEMGTGDSEANITQMELAKQKNLPKTVISNTNENISSLKETRPIQNVETKNMLSQLRRPNGTRPTGYLPAEALSDYDEEEDFDAP